MERVRREEVREGKKKEKEFLFLEGSIWKAVMLAEARGPSTKCSNGVLVVWAQNPQRSAQTDNEAPANKLLKGPLLGLEGGRVRW